MRKDSILNNKMPDMTRVSPRARLMQYAPFLIAIIILGASYTYVSGEVTTMFSEMLMASIYLSGGTYLVATLLNRYTK